MTFMDQNSLSILIRLSLFDKIYRNAKRVGEQMRIIDLETGKICIFDEIETLFADAQSLLDGISDYVYEGCTNFIFKKEHFPEDFYDLKTGLAGEILQKMTNYRLRVAIIGNFTNIRSNSLLAFILESNRGNQNFFLSSEEEAIQILSGQRRLR